MLGGGVRILQALDRGGWGTVYRALAPARIPGGPDEPCAVKILELEDDEEVDACLRRFHAEASITGLLRHPGIVKVHGHGRTERGAPYLVMELLEGEPLSRRLGRGALGSKGTQELLYQAADALAEAHALGIVHRDLQSSNLFLQRAGALERLKILDFGSAQVCTQALEAHEPSGEAELVGTLDFMAPEQAAGLNVDARADLYSLGVVAFACLTGRPPFSGPPAQLLLQHARTPAPAPSSLGAPVEPRLEALVLRLLAKAPAERPAHAGALRDLLAKLWA